jgi:spoIIIJ-associated protein
MSAGDRHQGSAEGLPRDEPRVPVPGEPAQRTVEATGETVGEAKWAALRELEQRHPGLDKSAVQFEVVSEGERGLLGVGYAPARVVASVPASAVEAVALDASEAGTDLHGLVVRIVNALGVDGRVDVHEDDAAITLTCVGADVGLLIGRHGQTIDAVQYLLNAIAHREQGDERKDVVVDAAGYRERRRVTLESMAVRSAQQVEATGERVELEPMTAVERKVVHLKLKEFAGVQTASEGAEPNRYVVVLPAD